VALGSWEFSAKLHRMLRFRVVLALLVAVCLFTPARAQRPYRILISNDDGVRAPGLLAIADALKAVGEVTIVAPAENQSATGHSLTINDPIRQEHLILPNGMAAISLTATPATTMKLALMHVVKERPDLVVSGINRGTNMGLAAYISGTVGAAREAAIRGIPAIATSLAYRAAGDVESYRAAAEATTKVVSIVKARGLPAGVFLNVNIPPGTMQTYKGLRLTTQGTATGGDESFDARTHPGSKRLYYWNVFIEGGTDVEGTDTWAVQSGYVAITPLRVGEFDRAVFDALRGAVR
jgi:5'-nucleotidase